MTNRENYRFERLATILLLLAFVLVVITGILSFTRLNRIIFTVNRSLHPDHDLIMVKEIYNDLNRAESYVKSYALSKNEDDMAQYNDLADRTNARMRRLRKVPDSDSIPASFYDTLDVLVKEKINILDLLLIVNNQFPVAQAMDEVMKNISSENKAAATVSDKVADTAKAARVTKKDNFFRRLFSKKERKNDQAGDSIPIPKSSVPVLTLDQISEQVQKAEQNAITREQYLREQELKLYQDDKVITERLMKMIGDLEIRSVNNLKHNTEAAEKEAAEVKLIIQSFGIASLFLLLLAGGVIFLYVKRNNEYRIILKKARSDAEELAQAKQRLLANMSHEIKTPMNIISGYLRQILGSPLDAGLHDRLVIVKKSSDHLLHLLNDLLDLSRLQADKMNLVAVDFRPVDLLNDIYLWFNPAAGDKHLRLILDTADDLPGVLHGDPVRLRQILFNLVSNAIKFTDQGTVTIRAYPGEERYDKRIIVFEVADTGRGIVKEDMERIFSEFEQGRAEAGKTEGSGLGLAITTRLIELHGGSIKVDSHPGEGSTFRVEIPFQEGKDNGGDGETVYTAGTEILAGKKVLIADDEAYNRSLLRLILEKYRCDVSEASGGKDAVQMAAVVGADIILMDIRMPGLNGPEAAAEIRKQAEKNGQSIPVIALCADPSAEDQDKLLHSGIVACLAKTFEEDELIRMIAHHLQKRVAHHTGVTATHEASLTPELKKKSTVSPIYDLTALRNSCNGNMKFFDEMIQMFLEDTGNALTDIERQIGNKEWHDVAELAHKISAPCRHLKADILYRQLKMMEQQSESEDGRHLLGESLRQARHEFELIREDILNYQKLK